MGNCLFHVQGAEFQQVDIVKKDFTDAFQAFYERTRSSYSKGFIYLSAKKIVCNEVARCQPASLRKKLFQTSSFMYFAVFYQNASQIRLLKVC